MHRDIKWQLVADAHLKPMHCIVNFFCRSTEIIFPSLIYIYMCVCVCVCVYKVTWHVAKYGNPYSGISALHLSHPKCTNTALNTHPEQWADIFAAAPGEQLGIWCLAHLCKSASMYHLYVNCFCAVWSMLKNFTHQGTCTFFKKVTELVFWGVTQYCNELLLKVNFPNTASLQDSGLYAISRKPDTGLAWAGINTNI